ncbi:acid protease, partial [Suillus decipiens]
LLLDNGSTNTWVCSAAYMRTSTSFHTGQPVGVIYEAGFFLGTEYLDNVTVSPGLTTILQSIGTATQVKGFDIVDCILGISPAALSIHSLQDLLTDPIPTITDTLYGQGTISENIFGIFYKPYASSDLQSTGQITFGGMDSTKYCWKPMK